jgi:hypothetical protein
MIATEVPLEMRVTVSAGVARVYSVFGHIGAAMCRRQQIRPRWCRRRLHHHNADRRRVGEPRL